MQILRTVFWVALLVAFVILTVLNWDITVAMYIWPGLVWDTRLPAIVITAFLLGLLPTWLLHRGVRWRLNRRISQLETASRAQAMAKQGATPGAEVTPAQVPPIP